MPLNAPTKMATDGNGNLVVYESGTCNLWRITPAGAQARVFPRGVSGLQFDIDGTLLVSGSNVMCRLMPDATSWLVAGGRNSGIAGFTGDGSSCRRVAQQLQG